MLSPYPYRYGLIVGLLAGLLGGYFNHTQTVSQSFKSRRDIQTFTERLQNALQEMGFEEKGKEEDYTVYEKSRLQTFFSGKMLVQMNRKGASVSGRAINMRKLKEKLDWE